MTRASDTSKSATSLQAINRAWNITGTMSIVAFAARNCRAERIRGAMECTAQPISVNKKPAAISRAGRSTFFDDVSMQVFCPTGQTILGKHERTGMSGTSLRDRRNVSWLEQRLDPSRVPVVHVIATRRGSIRQAEEPRGHGIVGRGLTGDEAGWFARLLRRVCTIRRSRCRARRGNTAEDANVSRIGLRRITGTRRCARLSRIGQHRLAARKAAPARHRRMAIFWSG